MNGAGKGDSYRQVNAETYGNNYDSIFRKPKQDFNTANSKWVAIWEAITDDPSTWEELDDEG